MQCHMHVVNGNHTITAHILCWCAYTKCCCNRDAWHFDSNLHHQATHYQNICRGCCSLLFKHNDPWQRDQTHRTWCWTFWSKHTPSAHQLVVHHACTLQVHHDCWNVHQTRCGACTCPKPPTTCLLMDWLGGRWSKLCHCHLYPAQTHCLQPHDQPADRHSTEVANLEWKVVTARAYL